MTYIKTLDRPNTKFIQSILSKELNYFSFHVEPQVLACVVIMPTLQCRPRFTLSSPMSALAD